MTLIRVILCMLAAALVAGTAGAAVRGPQHTTACAPSEGTVVGFINTASHPCGATHVGSSLGRNETVQSKASPASLTFGTNHLYRCIESSNSKDKLVGVGGMAIVHLSGTIRCKHTSVDLYKTVTTPNATISTSGTIYGITTTQQGTLVKSFDGLLRWSRPRRTRGFRSRRSRRSSCPGVARRGRCRGSTRPTTTARRSRS